MNKFRTDQENFIGEYKFFKAAVKNIDLDIEECSDSIEDVKRLEQLKQNYVKKVNIIDSFLNSLTEAV